MKATVDDDSDDPKAHFVLAVLCRRHGLLDDAVESLRRAAELDPKHANTQLNIGFFLHEAQRYEEALMEFKSIATAFPDEPRATYGIALALHQMKRYEEAIPYWETFIEAPINTFSVKARRFLREAEAAATNSSPDKASASPIQE
jgi:tetratricopeptide (TPR) repeat protein